MGKGTGCCGGAFQPGVGDKNAQVLEGETGLWLPCEIKEVNSLGMCAGKEWVVEYVPSGGQGMASITVPKEKLREIESAIKLGPDGQPDLDRDRGCTDCPCILLFLIFVAGWVILATVALDKGEPKRLLMPNDFRDEICGDRFPRAQYPEWFVPKPQYKLTYGVCVKACPEPGDIVCNNDWVHQDVFEASGLAWHTYPPPPEWGDNNKIFEMNATEVAEVNAMFPNSISPDLGSGITGTIARVQSQWPNVPIGVLDPLGGVIDCNWRERMFGAASTTFTRLEGKFRFPEARPCTPRERELLTKAAEVTLLVQSFNCFSVIYRSNPMVHRCVPLSNDREQGAAAASKLKALAKSTSAGRYLSDGFAEVKASWRVLVISAFTAIIISFIWLILVRILLKPIVYFILLLILAVLVAAGCACHFYANSLEDVTLPGDESHDRQVMTWRVFSYIFWTASVIYLVLMCWLINRIRIAIAVLEQASMALFSSPSVLIIPPLMFLFVVGWLVWFLVLAVHIQTVQDVTTDTFTDVAAPVYQDVTGRVVGGIGNLTGADTSGITDTIDINNILGENITTSDARNGTLLNDPDVIIRYMHLYNLFGFLWTVQLFIAMAFFVISGVVILWFWSASTAEIASGEKSKSTPVFAMKNAFYRMLRYHLGTLIFGALLIAIIQFVRAVLLYIEQQLPEEVRENVSFKVLKCCIHCFLAYMERLVKIINKNAFIITGIFGWNFCRSAAKALLFMMANIARVAVLTAMGEVVMFLLKLFICAANVYVGMVLLDQKSLTDDEEIESGLFPLFFVLCITFVISVIVMNCYDTCITTVFMCSLVDEDRAGDCGDSYVPYVPPSLAKLMDNFKEVAALEADYRAKMKHATALKGGAKVADASPPKKHQVAPAAPAQPKGKPDEQEQGES